MNVSLNLDSAHRGDPKPRSRSSSGFDLDCQEELFGHLADRSQLSIIQTLREGAKTDVQIATATGLSQSDISFGLDRLLGCGCVHAQDTGHLVLYGLSAPRLLQLEGIVDEMLIAALKGRRAPYD
jgi:hypothetical protein